MVNSRKGNGKGFGRVGKEEQDQASWPSVPVLPVGASGLSGGRVEAPLAFPV